MNFLETHRNVRLVTMDMGANDVFVLQNHGHLDPTCVGNGLPTVLATIQANLELIFGQIRDVAHYRGRPVTLSYYSLLYDPASVAATQALDAPIIAATQKFGGKIADRLCAFRPFAQAAGNSSCAAGLLIQLSPGNCDVHPSPLGRDILALAVASAVLGGQDLETSLRAGKSGKSRARSPLEAGYPGFKVLYPAGEGTGCVAG